MMFQKFRKSIAVKFVSITTIILVVWLVALNTLIMNGVDKALFKQANVFTTSLGEEQENGEMLLREDLEKKQEAILTILIPTAAGLISNYDYDTLGLLAVNTAMDSDVTFVVFYDADGGSITEVPSAKNGVNIVSKNILIDGDTVGSVELGVDDAAIKSNKNKVMERFEVMTKNAEEVHHDANASLLRLIVMGSFAGLIFICIAIFFTLSRVVLSPITKTSGMIRDIAQGEGDLTKRMEIQSEDEIGELGKWFNAFTDNIQKIVADVTNNAKLLNTSSDNLAGIAHSLSDSTGQTSEKCDTVAHSTDEMNQSTSTVVTAMEEASSNINMVASTTEEMTATITEIATNTEKAKNITDGAVSQSQSASKQVGQLGKAAEEIGNVIQTITEISEQVNLLALNATIEAARAGDAGKGFAVVANEIKDLAHQTATATEEIKNKVNGIQASTEATVTEINSVADVVDSINNIVTIIASAVEEQSAATQEISSNVAQASIGINDISDNVSQNSTIIANIATDIEEVTQATNDISSSSSQLDGSSQELSKLATELHSMIGRFKV